jgi:hypothetical protein
VQKHKRGFQFHDRFELLFEWRGERNSLATTETILNIGRAAKAHTSANLAAGSRENGSQPPGQHPLDRRHIP